MGLIVAENIGKNYQVGEIAVRASKGVSFTIEPASLVAFVMRDSGNENQDFRKNFQSFQTGKLQRV